MPQRHGEKLRTANATPTLASCPQRSGFAINMAVCKLQISPGAKSSIAFTPQDSASTYRTTRSQRSVPSFSYQCERVIETVETDVPALTGSGSRESGIDSTITSVLVGPLHGNIFGVCKGLVGLLVFSRIEHQCADLVVRRRPVAHGCVKQT